MNRQITEILRQYGKRTDDEWCRYIIKQDWYYRYFSEEQCDEFIMRGTQTGREMANRLKADGDCSPGYLCKKYRLSVKMGAEDDFLMPGQVNFAQYHDGTIIISQEYLDLLNPFEEQLVEELGIFDIGVLMFYHELFHYFEEKDALLENAGVTVSIRPIPFVTRRISPESVGEIAAFAFSKEMAGTGFHPCLMEMIFIALRGM